MRATYSPSTCGLHHMSLRQGYAGAAYLLPIITADTLRVKPQPMKV